MSTGWPFDFLLKYVFVFLASFLTAFLFTPAMKRLGSAWGLVDQPGGRHLHKRPVPRSGGPALFLAFHVGCAAVFLIEWLPFQGDLTLNWWMRFLAISSMLLVLGLIDDRWSLRPWIKLGGQAAVAGLAFALDMRVGKILGFSLPLPLDAALTIFWFLAIINAFNLIDGLDGLATGLAVIAAVGLAGSFLFRHMPGDALVLLGLIGGGLAFLRHNFYPAGIFLGDSGSMFLGLTLAAVPISTSAKGAALTAIFVPLLAVGVPMFDTFLAVWRRTARRIGARLSEENGSSGTAVRVFEGDLDHLHHRLLREGLSQRGVAFWLYGAAAALVAVGLLSMIYRSYAHGIYLLAFIAASYVVVRHLAYVELWDSGVALINGLRKPRPQRTVAALLPLLDLALLAGALWVATRLTTPPLTAREFKLFWFDQLLFWVGVPFLALFAVRAYSRIWRLARVSEFVLVLFALTGGILAAAAMTILTGLPHRPMDLAVLNLGAAHDETVVIQWPMPKGLALQTLLHLGLSITLIVGIRLLPKLVVDAMAWAPDAARHSKGRQDASLRTIVYGAGDRATLFLQRQAVAAAGREQRARVVGLLDDDPNLWGMLVYGQRVLGGRQHLERVIESQKAQQIVIAAPLDPDARRAALEAARRHDIPVWEWRVALFPVQVQAAEPPPPA